jgi:TatD DNase family protein
VQKEASAKALASDFPVLSITGVGLIDTHTHLDSFASRGELPAVLSRARAAGLEAMVAIGTDTDDWTLYRDLAREHPGIIHHTVGLHPCSVGEDWAGRVAQLEEFWSGAGLRPALPVALGEIGLDRFHLPKDAAEAEKIFGWQRAAFTEQLRLAKKLGCPVVIHSRDAFRECVEMIDASGVAWGRVVFHCFTEGPLEMAELTKRGGFGSFTGVITYKSAEMVRAAALAQGLDRLMIETDAPYLTPMPHRGKPNEPAYLRHTAEFSAGVFGVSLERLTEATTANAKRFFSI